MADVPPPRPGGFGCGCILPASGTILLVLTVVLAWAIARSTDGWSPLWLLLIPLVAGMVALFVRIRWSR